MHYHSIDAEVRAIVTMPFVLRDRQQHRVKGTKL